MKWHTLEEGIRYREHPQRRLKSGQPDRYWVVRMRRPDDGMVKDVSVGWQSKGWNIARVRAKQKEIYWDLEQKKPVTKKEKRAAQQEEERQQAEEQERQAKENMTLAHFFEKFYLTRAGLSEKHRKDDISRFKTHLAPVLGDKPMREIGPLDLERVKKRMTEAGRTPATVRHALAIVRSCFNRAISWDLFSGENPVRHTKLPRLNNQKMRVITAEEEARLLDALKARSKQTWAVSLVSLYSGMRFSEIAGLRWQNIDFEHDIIHVRGKGDRSRSVPMHHLVKEVLQDWKSEECAPTDLIFPAKDGSQQQRISALFYRVVKSLGLNEGREKKWKMDFHSLRHSFGSRAARLVPITDVRDILGHATLVMTSRYAKGNLERAAQALQSLGQEAQESNGNGVVIPLKQ